MLPGSTSKLEVGRQHRGVRRILWTNGFSYWDLKRSFNTEAVAKAVDRVWGFLKVRMYEVFCSRWAFCTFQAAQTHAMSSLQHCSHACEACGLTTQEIGLDTWEHLRNLLAIRIESAPFRGQANLRFPTLCVTLGWRFFSNVAGGNKKRPRFLIDPCAVFGTEPICFKVGTS